MRLYTGVTCAEREDDGSMLGGRRTGGTLERVDTFTDGKRRPLAWAATGARKHYIADWKPGDSIIITDAWRPIKGIITA